LPQLPSPSTFVSDGPFPCCGTRWLRESARTDVEGWSGHSTGGRRWWSERPARHFGQLARRCVVDLHPSYPPDGSGRSRLLARRRGTPRRCRDQTGRSGTHQESSSRGSVGQVREERRARSVVDRRTAMTPRVRLIERNLDSAVGSPSSMVVRVAPGDIRPTTAMSRRRCSSRAGVTRRHPSSPSTSSRGADITPRLSPQPAPGLDLLPKFADTDAHRRRRRGQPKGPSPRE